jgi:hypothetical protein
MLLDTILNIIKNTPILIPMYLFMAYLVGLLGWELVKLIIFVIRFQGKNEKKTKK